MFFKRLLSFSEDQKIDIAAQKLQLGEYEEAYSILKDIVNKSNKAQSLSHKLALSIYSKSGIRFAKKLEHIGSFNEALDIYLNINNVAPHFPDIHNSIANLKLILKDNYAAREHLEAALKLNPNYKDAVINMIKLAVYEDNYDEAIEYSERLESIVTGKEADFASSLRESINEKNQEKILEGLKAIIDLKDDHTSLYLRLGIELFNKQRYREAVLELQKYLQYKPNYADVMHILGVCYMEMKDFESAITTFINCLEINADFVLSRLHLAMSYKELGRLKEAENEFTMVIAADPSNKVAARFLEDLKKET